MYLIVRASPIAQSVNHLPAMQETQVRFLEEEMATHSSILAWKIPWTEEPGRLLSMGSRRVRHDLATRPLPPPPLNCAKLEHFLDLFKKI